MKLDQIIGDAADYDPDQYNGPVYPEKTLRERIAIIAKVLDTWKGQPGYAETIAMELWALRLAADYLSITRCAILEEAERAALPVDGLPLDKMVMVAAAQISEAARKIRGDGN